MARLIVLAGPTASGKSEAALALAEALGGEIVSCDSVAVYRGCDIGAAKPGPAERARVPHHLLDVADPDEDFTAARFAALAEHAIAGAAGRGRAVIVAGGSGLYLRALLDGLFEAPPPDPALRERLRAEAEALGWPALHARLATVDPVAASRIAPSDPVRIARALEVYQQTGEPISTLQARARDQRRHEARVFVVEPAPGDLERRIAARSVALVEGGLCEETARLRERWGRAVKPLAAVGYKQALACLDGAIARDALADAIRLATRHFARRQRTWFRKQAGERIDAARAVLEPDRIAALAAYVDSPGTRR